MLRKLPTKFSQFLLVTLFGFLSLSLSAQTGCDLNAGELNTPSGSVYIPVCLDDMDEGLTEITRTGFVGGISQYVLTTPSGFILEVLDGNPPFDLRNYGAINLAVWSISYSGTLTGFAIDDNICATGSTECFSLSNPVLLNRKEGDGCDIFCSADAGVLSLTDGGGTSTDLCITDGAADPVAVSLTGDPEGENLTFLITDDQGIILAIPAGNGPFDLSGAGVGTCLIWYLAYDDDLEGLAVGNNANDFDGCFALSNPISVIRRSVGTGVLAIAGSGNTEITICAGDEISDAFAVTLTDTMGDNFTYLITDDAGMVLGTPADQPFDLEGAGGGTCSIYALSFADNFSGVAAGDNIADFTGCFALSNPIVVTRQTGDECDDFSFTAMLSGLNEVPCPVTSTGRGSLTATLVGNTLTVSGEFSGLTSDFNPNVAGGAHLHTGLAGQNGGIAFRLTSVLDNDLRGGVFNATDNIFQLTDEQVTILRDRGLYVNIHTLDFGAGELRGQVVPAGADNYKVAYLLGVNEVPAVVTEAGGGVVVEREGNTITLSGSFSGLSGALATQILGGAHLHLGIAGRNGPVQFPLNMEVSGDMTAATFMADSNVYVLDDDQLAAFEDDMFYVNVHSATFLSGELRGQLTDQSVTQFYANPSGHQERPAPVNTTGNGRLVINWDGDETITLSGSVNDLLSPVDTNIAGGSHVHIGLPGRNGGIVFRLNLTLDADGNGGVWLPAENTFTLSPDQLNTFFDRGYYVNVHSTGFPSGEVRGQTMYLAKGYFGANMAGINANPEAVKSTGNGFFLFDWCGGRVTGLGSFNDLSSDFNANIASGAHIHLGDAASSGGIVFPLTGEVDSTLRNGFYLSADNEFMVDSVSRDALLAGNLYINIHTSDNPGGEIRGQILRDDNAFPTAPEIITPADSATVTVFEGGSDLEEGAFAAADDPNGDLLVYTIEITGPLDPEFEEVIACQKVGTDTISTASLEAIYDTLIAFGAMPGFSVDLLYRVIASDGSVATPGGSRSITLVLGEAPCTGLEGGNLALADGGGTAFTICAGDSIPDPFSVTLTDTVGAEFTYLVVSDQGVILGVPANQPFDFDGAGGGACTLYAVSHDGTLTGAEAGAMFSDLDGCFDLSNPIVVTRNVGSDCETCNVDGGTLALAGGGTAFTICAGDSIPDPFSVTLTDTVGAEFTYLVVSDQGVILGVPANQPFDFDGAGGGACTLYAVSHDGTLTGAEAGAMFSDLDGCFDLSNPIVVTRLTGEDCGDGCAVDGGILALDGGETEITICAGDGVDDDFNVILTDTSGSNFTYVITDGMGVVLGVPANQPFNLEGAGGGSCNIYALSFSDDFSGVAMGDTITNFSGCFDLSNPITVIRQTGEDCDPGLVGINEITRAGTVELRNLSNFSVNAGNLFLNSNGQTARVNSLTVECGSLFLKPGDQVTVDASSLLSNEGDELALSITETPPSTSMLMAYVAWGESDRSLEDLAVTAGIWVMDTDPGVPGETVSLQRIPTISFPTYALATPTPCAANTLTTGTRQQAADRVHVYPNPVGDRLTVELTGVRAFETRLQLLDLNGRVLSTRSLQMVNGRFDINTSGLPAGAYLLRLTNEAGISTARVIRR